MIGLFLRNSDDGAIELGAPAGVDGGWGEALPDDRLADCLNEEIDAGALLVQLGSPSGAARPGGVR